ncbi:fibronectin type III domain-containing protein [Candidatus Daviesbacteria bacterium]|nr:fibronectin type III domain-containing protein [Candidatus Daviesbacteria bacterium]
MSVVIAGVFFYQRQILLNQLKKINTPKNIQIANITDNSVTILWQTDLPVSSHVLFGKKTNLGSNAYDERDNRSKQARLTHFVTLKNLKAETNYNYQIKVSQFLYPQTPLNFKTAKKLTSLPSFSNSPLLLNPPLRGSIIDNNFSPIDEAIVLLKIEGVSQLATFSTNSGNFILPLTKILKDDLQDLFDLKPKTHAILTVFSGNSLSEVKVLIPLEESSLPAVKLGQSYDLRESLASPSAKLRQEQQTLEFDLNHDGQVNSIDLSIVVDNLGKKSKDPNADLNRDGRVDQKDVELMRNALK